MNREDCKLKLELDGFTVGYVGRLVPEKGVRDLLEALALTADVNLVIVGSGPEREALDSRAAELGVSSRVRFLGPRPLSELPEVMNAIDVLALPSRTTRRWKEQFGRVIIEAQACGTPVIGSDSGAIPEVVADGGLVVPEQNPSALAEALAALRVDPTRRFNLGETGRRNAEQNYTWRQVALRMSDIYHEVATNRVPTDALTGASV